MNNNKKFKDDEIQKISVRPIDDDIELDTLNTISSKMLSAADEIQVLRIIIKRLMNDKADLELDVQRLKRAPMGTNKILLTIKDMYELYSLKENSIRWLVRKSMIPIVKIGKRIYFDKKEIDKWLEERKIEVNNSDISFIDSLNFSQ